MIVRPRLHWLRMLVVWRGSILKQVLPQLIVVLVVSVVVTAAVQHFGWRPGLSLLPFSLLGISVAIFLGFRNNASYERFWEARKLWGALVIESRNLARQICTLTQATAEERRRLVYLIIGFAHALRHQLRGTDAAPSLSRVLGAGADLERLRRARFKPAMLLLVLGEGLQDLRLRGGVEPILASTMEPVLNGLSGVLAGCERIASTPIPFTYSVIIHRVIYLFIFLLPFGLVETVGWWTPLVVAFNAYMFFTLEALSHEIEEPFGTMPNDLALEAMCTTVEASLRESLGEAELPSEPEPVDCALR
jgi:putative membrane protein